MVCLGFLETWVCYYMVRSEVNLCNFQSSGDDIVSIEYLGWRSANIRIGSPKQRGTFCIAHKHDGILSAESWVSSYVA